MARTTTYEAGFDKTDLLGASEAHLSAWAQGLRFGFAFAVNDGDAILRPSEAAHLLMISLWIWQGWICLMVAS